MRLVAYAVDDVNVNSSSNGAILIFLNALWHCSLCSWVYGWFDVVKKWCEKVIVNPKSAQLCPAHCHLTSSLMYIPPKLINPRISLNKRESCKLLLRNIKILIVSVHRTMVAIQ